MIRVCLLALLSAAVAGLAGCSTDDRETATVVAISTGYAARGAGGTFAQHLYREWAEEFNTQYAAPLYVYYGVGSAEGIVRFIDGAVDFGASDVRLSAQQLAAIEQPVQTLPMAGGLLVLAYNLGDQQVDLKLSRELYLGLFSGQIQGWDDPAIAAINPGIRLPAEAIVLVARQTGSGLTAVLSRHLGQVDAQWRARHPDLFAEIDWPASTVLARSNQLAAEAIAATPYSLGYIDLAAAVQQRLAMASLENKAGRYIAPTVETGLAAIQAAVEQSPGELLPDIADPDAAGAYPIVMISSLLLHERYSPLDKDKAIRLWIAHGLADAQQQASALRGYIPLPEALLLRAREAARRHRDDVEAAELE